MKRRRRRSTRGKRKYSIPYLLSKQPKWIRKHPYYSAMIRSLRISPSLTALRFNGQCCRLLQNAGITPENLSRFCRTYRLPRDQFFPLFLRIRKDYLNHRQSLKQAKEHYIRAKMEELPGDVRRFLEFFRDMESRVNAEGKHPVWDREIFPSTKKRVHQYLSQNRSQWTGTFGGYFAALTCRYRRISEKTADRLLACFILNCLPAHTTAPVSGGYMIGYPDRKKIMEQFRILSMEYHPDRGGQPELFIRLAWAKNLLLEHNAVSGR